MLPVVACTVGVAALFVSWRGRLAARGLTNIIAWSLITASVFLWVPLAGPEFGPVYAFMTLPLIAWVFVLANGERRPHQRDRSTTRPAAPPAGRSWLRHACLFFAAIPLAAVASALVALLTTSWLPWNEIDRMVLGVLVMPLVWGLLAVWVCADRVLLRPVATLAGAGLLSAVLLYG